jgi:hypothetical protein
MGGTQVAGTAPDGHAIRRLMEFDELDPAVAGPQEGEIVIGTF